MDVGVWLRSLGLGQYEAAFRDNEVDGAVLPKLTVEDLKDLGVAIVGHRRKIMSAIEEINAASVARTDAMKPPQTQASPSVGASPDGAERRPITILFCDLVGSTSLAANLDAEDWRNLVNAYLDEASAAVTDLGGHVLKKLGDGLMALFGYPRAQENDAERAVRAALAIQRALAELNARNARSGAPELSARIGIECGSVVVDAAGEVFGEAPNVAARVQAAAEPGTVLITASVQRQTAGLFVAEDKGAHELKGVLEPITLYRIVRASGAGRRGGARALTPLVGREEELDLLSRRWERARKGEGQLALIVGEPGLGKSRLIEEFRARLGETPHTWVEWSSSQLLQNTPLHPVAEWGRLRYGGGDTPEERRLADLENTLRLIGLDAAEYAPLLGPLFDVPLPEDRTAKFPPEELRRRQLSAMTALFLAGARSQPIVLAFEDLHWADPTSLDLLRALAERGAQAPLLIVVTTRPEFRPDWSLRSHHSVISLAPLDRAQVRRMVGEIAASHALPADVVDGVGERTGGVPLFVEEVTRLLLERGAGGGVQTIPPTLQQSLAARLDRLGEAREVAQIGAVLGREFSYRLLQAVAGVADPGSVGGVGDYGGLALQTALDRLTEADFLIVEGAPPSGSYRFKHALIQDAAYESLLKSRRQALHRRAAEALRDANAEPEAIAHHFTEASLDDAAIEWWGKAGDQALRRSAFQEAIAHLGKAIAMADKGATARRAPGGPAAPSRGLTQLRVAYGNALIAARGYGAPETTQAFARARESASGDMDAPERLATDYGLWVGSYNRGELPSMRAHAAAFLHDVEAGPDSPEAGVAHRAAGMTCWFAGEYREARDHFERALALFQPGRDDDLAFRFGHDLGVGAMFNLAIASWPLGEVDRAISLIDRMQMRIAHLTHVGSLAVGRMHATLFELMRGDQPRAAPNAFELARLAREHDLTMFRAFGVFLEGSATAASCAAGSGLDDMRRGVELLREQNVLIFDGLLKIALAEAEARAGDPDRAIAILDEALATSGRTGHRAFEAELHRARGELLLKRDPVDPTLAEDTFLTAIAVAKEQGTRSFELRASLSLAKLYQSTGRPVEAHDVLGPALEGFSPTTEFPDIAEGQALFQALAETDDVKAATTTRHKRVDLQLALGNALIAARGYGAAETQASFERARALTFGTGQEPERFSIAYGLYGVSYHRGDVSRMREHASAFLSGVSGQPDSPVAGVAHRISGIYSWYVGDLIDARTHLEKALAISDPERDSDLAFRFGHDPRISASVQLGVVLWLLGEVVRAAQLFQDVGASIPHVSHLGTTAQGNLHAAMFEVMRGNHVRAAEVIRALASVAYEHDLALWKTLAFFLEGWSTWHAGDRNAGLVQMRAGVAKLAEREISLFGGLIRTELAQAEAESGEVDASLITLENALVYCERIGQRWFDAEIHRVRGEILLKKHADGPAPAEDAYLAAIAIAQRQKARSFELRAALSLAKMYQSTVRPADAHAVLAPALEGFSPTLEMPEIAEAQTLMAALAEFEEVKSAITKRERRLHLQTAFGQAVMWSKGFAAEETKAAFARATEFATRTSEFSERFAAAHGQWMLTAIRGELRSAWALASTFLHEAEETGRVIEAGVAHRSLAMTAYFLGDFVQARTHSERALAACDPERDEEARERFGQDTGTSAMSFVALTNWQMGEVERAREFIERANRRAIELGHVQSMAHALYWKAYLEILRGDPRAALSAATGLEALARDHGMRHYSNMAELTAGWARGRLGDPTAGADRVRRALAAHLDQGFRIGAVFYTGLLAELEAETLGAESALGRTDEAMALAHRAEYRFDLAFLHRIRGGILFKQHVANPAPAKEAFEAAISVSNQQGARSHELLASLSLAKLYQSTGRPVDAHAVLARALEGFAPTPEMPEIAEAQALLVAIEAGAHVRHE